MMQQMVDASQTTVNGDLWLNLYKGNVIAHAGNPQPTACSINWLQPLKIM